MWEVSTQLGKQLLPNLGLLGAGGQTTRYFLSGRRYGTKNAEFSYGI